MNGNENEIDFAAIFEEDAPAETTEPQAEAEVEEAAEAEAAPERSEDNPPDVADGEAAAERAAQASDAGEPVQQAQPEGQSAEENSRYAAARRDAERQRDEAIAARDREHQAFVNRVFADLGITNPYTGQVIRTKEEYDAYAKAKADETRRSFMAANNLTEAQYNELVNGLPEVREAREAALRAKEAERQAADARSRAALAEQIKEITKIDPTIKSPTDLIRHASYPKIYEMVKRGYSAYDAYRLANMDALNARAAAAARQQTINNQAGKEHLMQTASRGSGAAPVPAEVKEQYRMLNPDMSDAEIARDYAKYLAQTKNSK